MVCSSAEAMGLERRCMREKGSMEGDGYEKQGLETTGGEAGIAKVAWRALNSYGFGPDPGLG